MAARVAISALVIVLCPRKMCRETCVRKARARRWIEMFARFYEPHACKESCGWEGDRFVVPGEAGSREMRDKIGSEINALLYLEKLRG